MRPLGGRGTDRFLKWNVLGLSAVCRCRREGRGDGAAGRGGVDLLVDDTDFDGPADATGNGLVFGGEAVVQRITLVVRGGGEGPLVQDADGGLRAHDGDLGARPRVHRGGTERT